MKLSRKVLSLLAVLALIGTMLSVVAVTTVGAEVTNLLTNGDFENGINGWSTHFGNGNTSASSTYHTGAGSTAHKGWNGDPFYQTVSVTPGKTYEVTYWAKGGGVGSFCGVVEGTAGHSAALYYLGDGKPEKVAEDITVLGQNSATAAYSDWTKVKFYVTPATGSMTIGFTNGGNGSWLWIDDVSIVEYVEPVVQLVNGDFENGINGWSTHFGNGNTSASTTCHTGAGGTAHKGWNGDPFYQTLDVVAGTTYEVTYWAKGGGVGSFCGVVEGTGGHSAALYYLGDGNTEKVAGMDITVLGQNSATAAYSDWTKVKFYVTPATSSMTIGFTNGGNGSWLWIDDVSIKKYVEPVVQIVNGDFEDGITGWSTHFGNGKSGADKTVAHTGDGSVAHEGWNGDPFYQTLNVVAGRTYAVTYWAKGGGLGSYCGVVEGTGSHSAALYYLGDGNTEKVAGMNITVLGQKNATSAYGAWTKETIYIKPSTESITIGFTNGGNGSWFWTDDVSIAEVGKTISDKQSSCSTGELTAATYADGTVGLGFVNKLTLEEGNKLNGKAVKEIGFIVATKKNADKNALVLECVDGKKFLKAAYDTIGSGDYNVTFCGITKEQINTKICGRLYIILEDDSVVYNNITTTSYADLFNALQDHSQFSEEIKGWFAE